MIQGSRFWVLSFWVLICVFKVQRSGVKGIQDTLSGCMDLVEVSVHSGLNIIGEGFRSDMTKWVRPQKCFRHLHCFGKNNLKAHCLHYFLTDSPTKQTEIVRRVSFQILPKQ